MEAQRGSSYSPRSHSQAHYAPRPPASRILRAAACPRLLRYQKDGSDTLHNPHTPTAPYLRKPDGPGLRSQLLRRGALAGRSQAGPKGEVRAGPWLSPGVGAPLKTKSPDSRDAASTAGPTSPPGLLQVCNWGARLQRRSPGAAGRSGGRGEWEGAEPSGGHPANRHSTASPLRPASLSAGGGGAGRAG